MAVKRICWYIQGTQDKGIGFNPYKKTVVDCYVDAYFGSLWGHENPQDTNFDRNRDIFVVIFDNFSLLWL